MKRLSCLLCAGIALNAAPALAEMELSFYLGSQGVADSTLSGTLPGGAAVDRSVSWEGNSFSAPLYYGGRAIWWTDSNFGFGIEATHTKAYASDSDRAALGVERLELSDGHNIFTLNVMKRWPDALTGGRLTPYLGGGLGVAVPHVDVLASGARTRTHEYQTTGPALRGIAGVKLDLNERWGVFGEYQMTWSDNELSVDPDPGQSAGTLNTEITTHAFNLGLSFGF